MNEAVVLITNRDGDKLKAMLRDGKADPIIICERANDAGGDSVSVFVPDWFAEHLVTLFKEVSDGSQDSL